MKTKLLMVVVFLAGLAATDRPLFAHHGAAAYDMSKPVVLKDATVTEFVWINPHPLIKADYKDEKGEVLGRAGVRRRRHALRLASQDEGTGWTLQQGHLLGRDDHA